MFRILPPFLLFVTLLGPLSAGNPIVPGKGLCDPAVRVYGDTVYLYGTHDASPASKTFTMHDWWIWSSKDLVSWKYESTVRPEDTFLGKPFTSCWAVDSISRDGAYYFYASVGRKQIAVVKGKTPIGPFTDPIGKPLIPDQGKLTEARDPAIFQAPDGDTYLVYGTFNYYIAKLNRDMVSLSETPRKIQLDQLNGPYGAGRTDDKPYLHAHDGHYYLSWGCFYAMADHPYGPYVYKGSIIIEERTAPIFRKSLLQDRHGSFFEFNHQWYFACNDKSYPGTQSFFRNTILSYVHYRRNGEIEPIYITELGVGEYEAGRRIEAENYFDERGMMQAQNAEGGFELRGMTAGSHAIYPNVRGVAANALISFHFSAETPDDGTIEIHADRPDGPLLGSCKVVRPRGESATYTLSTPLETAAGDLNVCLVFTSPAMRLDGFELAATK